jgi:hypothetical protein
MTRVRTCPLWGSPFAVGGPSKKMNRPFGAGFTSVASKIFSSRQKRRISRSSWGKSSSEGTFLNAKARPF